ncbi:carbohydrate porin [Amphibiibacter pelophylacis]|uniref:Carbohydrate porin n=1 Tax=Amphibiibacter pelophylacis TaxID=1799477 RepID=A0ACC6P371_9BURK
MKLIVKVLAAAAALTVSGVSMAQVTMDANLELNPTITNRTATSNSNSVDTDGRVEVNLAARKSLADNYFVAGRGTLLLKLDGTTAVDDAWGQFGTKLWDVKLGRFEAMDLFPLGKDTLVVDARLVGDSEYAFGYNANDLRGRVGAGQLHAALGVNPMPGLRAELGIVHANDTGAGRVRGLRPAVSYTTGPLTLRGGIEYVNTLRKSAVTATTLPGTITNPDGSVSNVTITTAAGSDAVPSSSATGFGLSLGYNLGVGTDVNVNYAKKKERSALGANIVMGDFGLGAVYARNTDTNRSRYAVYTAYSLPLLDIKGATITPALSFGKNTGSDTQVAARVRVNYAF